MFKKILIATDLSAASDAVINCMANIKTLGVEEVILFYACGIKHLNTMAELIKLNVEPYLLQQQRKLESQGFKTNLEIAPGFPAVELKRVAKQNDVSLIVIGSQGESAFKHLILRLGGVSSEILHSHDKPLLLVRNKAVEENGKFSIQSQTKDLKDKILFTTDFSDISRNAFQYVEKLVEDGCKNITLLHIQDKVHIEKHLSNKLEEFNQIDTGRLETLKKQLLAKGADNVVIKILYGVPAKEILDESKHGYSLIVMGSQGRGFFNEIFIGSVSHTVARNSDVSLLLIPSIDR